MCGERPMRRWRSLLLWCSRTLHIVCNCIGSTRLSGVCIAFCLARHPSRKDGRQDEAADTNVCVHVMLAADALATGQLAQREEALLLLGRPRGMRRGRLKVEAAAELTDWIGPFCSRFGGRDWRQVFACDLQARCEHCLEQKYQAR